MFEISREYFIKTIVPDGGGGTVRSSRWRVAAFDGTLLKLVDDHDVESIVNTAGLHFLGAEPVPQQPNTEREDAYKDNPLFGRF